MDASPNSDHENTIKRVDIILYAVYIFFVFLCFVFVTVSQKATQAVVVAAFLFLL